MISKFNCSNNDKVLGNHQFFFELLTKFSSKSLVFLLEIETIFSIFIYFHHFFLSSFRSCQSVSWIYWRFAIAAMSVWQSPWLTISSCDQDFIQRILVVTESYILLQYISWLSFEIFLKKRVESYFRSSLLLGLGTSTLLTYKSLYLPSRNFLSTMSKSSNFYFLSIDNMLKSSFCVHLRFSDLETTYSTNLFLPNTQIFNFHLR